MTDEHSPGMASDPERDARLARLLAEEYGVSQSALAGRVQSIMSAVSRQSHEPPLWWTAIATWARILVPISATVAAAALCFLLWAPSAIVTPNTVAYPDSSGGATVVRILATRATSQDVAATLMPGTADELLTAAVRP